MDRNVEKFHPEYDLLRIAAIWCVIFNHTGIEGYLLFTRQTQSPFYWIYMLISMIAKMGVPVFWMISGALLLQTQETPGQIIKRRVLRMLAVLLTFSLLQYLGGILQAGDAFSLRTFLRTVYSYDMAPAYWYLYAYIAYLCCLPFLRKLAHSLSAAEFRYLFLLRLLFGAVLPLAQELFFRGNVVLNPSLMLPFAAADLIFYPLLGYYLSVHTAAPALQPRAFTTVGILALLSFPITALITNGYLMRLPDTAVPDLYFPCLLFLPAAFLFMFSARIRLLRTVCAGARKAIRLTGGAVFSTMLLENILRDETLPLYLAISSRFPKLPSCFLWVTSVLILGLLIGMLLKQVPILRKLI